MFWLNLIPIPRRFEKLPGAFAFAFVAAAVLYFAKEGTKLSIALMAASVIFLILTYTLRARQKKEWEQFFYEENRRLLDMKGSDGPARYISGQRKVVSKLRNRELKIPAQLNLSAALLANADPSGTLEVLLSMDPTTLPLPTFQLIYWTQTLGAYLQLDDQERVEAAYEMAIGTFPEVSDMLKISFMPSEIQYRLFRGEYELALNQLSEIPTKDLDEAGQALLTALRIWALRGVGAIEKANKLTEQLQMQDLLPSTKALLHKVNF